MRKLLLTVFLILINNCIYSQGDNIYKKGLTADQNLNAILNLAPYSTGGVGFDDRYEGIKGSTRLFDKLLPSFLKIKGQDYYLQLETDIDLVANTLMFNHPKTGELLSIPSDMVSEVIIKSEGKELIFRTTGGKSFETGLKEQKFFQVLKEAPFQFIKMPVKTFREADYKGAYSPDRRFDEFETKFRYYIFATDDIFHQIQLNRKALVKLFPDKKELINNIFEAKSSADNEEIVMSLLEKF